MRSLIFMPQAIVSHAARSRLIYMLLILSISYSVSTMAWAGPIYGGTLRLLGEVDAMGFDAIKARSALGGGRAVGSLVMEKLFARDNNDEIISVLGISAKPSEDGKAWTIELRRGVRFHDGMPFNADAVIHHWQRLLDPKNRYRQRILFRPIIGIEKTGEYEVRFLLRHAWVPFMAVLTDPSGFTSLIPSPKAVKEEVQNRTPVGTGPFVFPGISGFLRPGNARRSGRHTQAFRIDLCGSSSSIAGVGRQYEPTRRKRWQQAHSAPHSGF